MVDDLPAAQRSLRIAVVTETYPPEVNGVALTLRASSKGCARGITTSSWCGRARPRSDMAARADRFDEVLMRGLPIPRYPDLQHGPAGASRRWSRCGARRRPDVVHIVTEGPLGWSALQAARELKLPVCSDFRTNFHAYSQHYGIGWLQQADHGLPAQVP